MLVPLSYLAFAAILTSNSLGLALSPTEISPDLPVASLISSAGAHLAKGHTSEALTYYDVAISRDPKNYLTLFKRGATYLSLGRASQALADFNAVLEINNDFEAALIQRAKIMAGLGDWDAARRDYKRAGHKGQQLTNLVEAEGAAKLADDAGRNKDYESCITHAGAAIMVANRNLALRQLRARCHLEQGHLLEAIGDLAHVLQIQPGLTDPHLLISTLQFFSLGETERGLAQIRKCLHSDPDSKTCKKLHRSEKSIDKSLAKVKKHISKRMFSTAAKSLVGTADEPGLLQDIKEEFGYWKNEKVIPPQAQNELYIQAVELACEAHMEVSILSY